jgi:hypothetical protein
MPFATQSTYTRLPDAEPLHTRDGRRQRAVDMEEKPL